MRQKGKFSPFLRAPFAHGLAFPSPLAPSAQKTQTLPFFFHASRIFPRASGVHVSISHAEQRRASRNQGNQFFKIFFCEICLQVNSNLQQITTLDLNYLMR